MSKNIVFRIFFLLICFFTISITSSSQTNYPVTTENGKSYYIYTVQPAEGLFAISKKFEITQDEIKAANPGLDSGLKIGQKIRIPASAVNTQSKTHTVAPGETLYSIATRYGATVEEITKLNPDAKNTVKVGQVLTLPQKNKVTIANTNPSASETRIHTVASGETLYSIATRYGVTVKDISTVNPDVEKGINAGQKITIPAKNTATAILPQAPQNATRTYVVSAGDTLYSLAKSTDVTVEELIRLNPDAQNGLKVGDTITIPEKKEDSYIYHVVKESETLYSISNQYGLSQEQVIASNPGLSANSLAIGKRIRLDNEVIKKNQIEREQRELLEKSTFTYVAEKKEKVEDIAKRFNVTVDDLKKINKKVPKNLSKGDKIEIPSPKVTSTTKPSEDLAPAPANLSNATPQIAIMLPFMANVKDKKAESDRMIEYYGGFLLALNEMKQKGFSADIHVFDTKNTKEGINKILNDPKMKKMNLIIGPAYDENVPIMSSFSKTNSIPLVIPFTSRNNSFQDNSFIYQVNSPQNSLFYKSATVFAQEYANCNIIIVSADGIPDDKISFTNTLTDHLKKKDIPYSNVKISGNNADALEAKLSTGKKNIIVPTFSSSSSLERTLPIILKLKQKDRSKEIRLFGYPEWQTYGQDIRKTFLHPLNTCIFSPFYASMSSLETSKLRNDYMKAYTKDIIPTFPKFALLGYDTGKYFMTAIQKFGYKFHENLPNYIYTGVQMNFNFERTSYWSGFLNRNIFFVHFVQDSDTVTASSYR